MDALALLHRAQEVGLRIERMGDRLLIRGPKRAEAVVQLLAAHKAEVLATLAPGPSTSKCTDQDAPVAHTQARRWRDRLAKPTEQAENAEQSLSPNRHLIEVPDRFAAARWSRDADVATIARCILGTLKYEPHTADITVLQQALEGVIKNEVWHAPVTRGPASVLGPPGDSLDAAKHLWLPLDEPPAKPPAEAPQPQTQPSASKGIPEDRRGFVGYVDGRFVHYCPECGEWGAHGIGVFLRRGQLGVWYCAAHKPKT